MDQTPEKHDSKFSFTDILVVVTCLLAAFAFVWLMRDNKRLATQNFSAMLNSNNKVNAVYHAIGRMYVDTLDRKMVEDAAINAMIKELDPHSVYLPKDKKDEATEVLEGNFSGVGIQYQMHLDTVVVIKVIPAGPSYKAGLLAGDRIVSVDDSIIAGKKLQLNDVPSLLKGREGSRVTLGISRKDSTGLIKRTVTRGSVPLPSIDVAYMYDDATGYIKLTKFSRTTQPEFLVSVNELKRHNMRRLVLDLRDNTGGYLEAAIGLLDEFFPKDTLLVYTEGRARPRREYRSNGNMSCRGIQVAVLINENTASASEIVAGALQDHERGIIVGRRSYGKGLVQEQIGMRDGSAIRLTVARYYTPLGRCIQKPYTLGDETTYNQEVSERYASGEMLQQDSIRTDAGQIVYTRQSHHALYGGGGITPDLFVAMDTVNNTPFLRNVSRKSLAPAFAFDYADANRKMYAMCKNWKEMQILMEAEHVWDAFLAYAAKEGCVPQACDEGTPTVWLKAAVEAAVARHILGDTGFQPIVNQADPVVTEAVNALKEKDFIFDSTN